MAAISFIDGTVSTGNFGNILNWIFTVGGLPYGQVAQAGDSVTLSDTPTTGTCAGNLVAIDTGISPAGGVVSGSVNLTGDGSQTMGGMTAASSASTWTLDSFADLSVDPGCIVAMTNFAACSGPPANGIIDNGGNVFGTDSLEYAFIGGSAASTISGLNGFYHDLGDTVLHATGTTFTRDPGAEVISGGGCIYNSVFSSLINDDGSGTFGAYTFDPVATPSTSGWTVDPAASFGDLTSGNAPNGLTIYGVLRAPGETNCTITILGSMVPTAATLTLDGGSIVNTVTISSLVTHIIVTNPVTGLKLDYTAPASGFPSPFRAASMTGGMAA